MLRRLSMLAASVAMVGLCAVPASAATSAAHATTHNFTVPAIKKHNLVKGWGSYTKINSERVHVRICVQQTGNAFAVGAMAVAYKANGQHRNISAFVIEGHKGQKACGQVTFLFYGAHLKVHDFIGKGGRIIFTGPVKTLY